MEQRELHIVSSFDGTLQPSLFYKSEAKKKRPLLVGLHTWSCDRFNLTDLLLPECERLGFSLLLPQFRGPNLVDNPKCTEACGSQYAKRDIVDAIDYVIENEGVDRENIFLLGLSGGGHMALLMAGFRPELFKAIGAFVPICDLAKWERQNENYRRHIIACCSGDAEEMAKRSPMSYIDTIAKANVKIFHGKYDDCVPVSHSLELYSAINEKYPGSRVFLDIFDGGHQIDMGLAMGWILSQYGDGNMKKITG